MDLDQTLGVVLGPQKKSSPGGVTD